MPRVPNEALRHRAMVEKYSSSGAKGPVFDPPVEVRCNVQFTNRLLFDTYGREIHIDARLIFRPEAGPFPVESKVSLADGRVYRIVRAYPYPDDRRPTQWEVLLAPWVP